jgi:hypothetical protein
LIIYLLWLPQIPQNSVMNSTDTLALILNKLWMFFSGGMNEGWRILAFTAWL